MYSPYNRTRQFQTGIEIGTTLHFKPVYWEGEDCSYATACESGSKRGRRALPRGSHEFARVCRSRAGRVQSVFAPSAFALVRVRGGCCPCLRPRAFAVRQAVVQNPTTRRWPPYSSRPPTLTDAAAARVGVSVMGAVLVGVASGAVLWAGGG